MTEGTLQNHSIGAIQKKAQILGLKKSREGFREIMERVPGRPHKEIEIADQPEELGYIIGVLFSDGHLTNDRIMLGVMDGEFAKKFADALNLAFPGMDARIRHDMAGIYWCTPRSVIVAKYLKERYTIEWCLKQPPNVKVQILRGMWDGDGCITLHARNGRMHSPRVEFVSSNIEIARLYQRLVKEVLGVELNVLGPYGKGKQYRMEKRGFSFANRFYEDVSPTIRRKRDRFKQAIAEA